MAHAAQSMPIASQSGTSSSGLWKGLQSPLTFGLVICGGVGAFLFTVVYLIEGVTRPGYDAWQQAISALSLGPGGALQQVSFVVFGVLLLLSTIGWYRLLSPGHAAIWFPLLQGIAGLALIGAGFFSMDLPPGYPPGTTPSSSSTLHGTLHGLFAYTIILTLALGCFVLAVHFWQAAHWRGGAVYSAITGALILFFFWRFVENATGPVAGLAERISAGSHALWLCALVVMLLFQRRRLRIQA